MALISRPEMAPRARRQPLKVKGRCSVGPQELDRANQLLHLGRTEHENQPAATVRTTGRVTERSSKMRLIFTEPELTALVAD